MADLGAMFGHLKFLVEIINITAVDESVCHVSYLIVIGCLNLHFEVLEAVIRSVRHNSR